MPLSISLNGQVGLVTGAGSPFGIGRSLVLSLAEAGAKVVYACDLNINNIPSLQQEVKDAGSSCIVEARLLDVSSEESTISILKEITRNHGRFDFYFANAGFANYRALEDLESTHWDRAISVMTTSVFYALKHGSKAMMLTSSEKPKPGGNFVITSSCAAYLEHTQILHTVAVNGLVVAGSVQLCSSNIRVNGIAPGFTNTSLLTSSSVAEKGVEYKIDADVDQIRHNQESFFQRAGLMAKPEYYYNRMQEAAEMANLAVFLASDLASSVNGHVVLADSGKTAAATGEACTGPVLAMKPLDLS